MKLVIEEIKKRLSNKDKNLEPIFSYLDELIEKKRILLREGQLALKPMLINPHLNEH